MTGGERAGGSRHGLESDEVFVFRSKYLGVGKIFEKCDGDLAAGAGKRERGVRANQGKAMVKVLVAQHGIKRVEDSCAPVGMPRESS